MKNIYFPDEEITKDDLKFMCYMIERVARRIKQKNCYVIDRIGKSNLRHLISVANVLHCMNPEQVEDDWMEEYALEQGDLDVTKVDETIAGIIPTALQMGKVYQRLIVDTAQPSEDYVDGMIRVYHDPLCEVLDNYTCGAFYEPSYVIARAYFEEGF